MTNDFTGGWIKLHRKLTDWEWYTDINVKVVFLHLILTANFKESRYKGNVIPVGSVLTTADELAQETSLSVWQVRTAIDKLKSTGEIQITRQFRKLLITISKYATYQCAEGSETNLLSNTEPIYSPTYNQFTTNLQYNKKEIKKESKERIDVEEAENPKNPVGFIETIKPHTESLLKSQSWREAICMKHHISIAKLDKCIDAFDLSNKCREISHSSEADIKRHFDSWLTIHLAQEKKEQKNRPDYEVPINPDYEKGFE